MEGEVDIEDLIPQEECVVTLTHFGYLKRQPLDVYKTQRRGGRGISGMSRRDEDFVSEIYTCSTHDYLMFFTNKGKVYRIKGYEIPEGSRSSRGTNVVNILPLEQEEQSAAEQDAQQGGQDFIPRDASHASHCPEVDGRQLLIGVSGVF